MINQITVRGARQHNLKNIDVEFPRETLTVVTGLSGSGKSSLAFDIIYAEGQRRYVQTLSAYARQFLDQMERPDADAVEGLSPAISIEQETTSRSPRSTVGTITEIYDYLRLLYSSIGVPHCHNCGRAISRQTTDQIVSAIIELERNGGENGGERVMILAPVVRGRKGEFRKQFEQYAKDGFLRARVDGRLRHLDEEIKLDRRRNHTIEIVVDRLLLKPGIESRLASSIETAIKLAKGIVQVAVVNGEEHLYSQEWACVECGISIPALEPRSFSFNSVYGGCPACRGLGSQFTFDPGKVIQDWTRPLFAGGLGPGAGSSFMRRSLMRAAENFQFDLHTPFERFPRKIQNLILYGKGPENSRRAPSFVGIIPLLDRWYSESTSQGYREWFEQYMSAAPCPACKGKRLRAESLAATVGGLSIADFTALPVVAAVEKARNIKLSAREEIVARRILQEITERLEFLQAVGLGYLSLDRSAATLSSGESQRVRLATQIGSKLRGVLYVLDEPSIGLHPRDNTRLLRTLKGLRDLGNTVLVVEHDSETIFNADWILDLGPGAGEHGGRLVAEGTVENILAIPESLTGAYLSGRMRVPIPEKRRNGNGKYLRVVGAHENNLKNIDVSIPLGKLVCITGVSGSGKSTLMVEILYKALARELNRAHTLPGAYERIEGVEFLDKIINIDQSPIGRTPRSNPGTYTGLFDHIRQLFAELPESKVRGYKPGRFSFNVHGGRCEACQGQGQLRIEMQFLPDVYVPCDVCHGARFNRETLQVRFKDMNIAEVLELTVEEALGVFSAFPSMASRLQTLNDVGLGYIRIGQPAPTLSGGEAQRVKLARELSKRATGRTMYVLDEPSVGLHAADVHKLIEVLQRLVDAGNSVVIIEHNLDIVKVADYLIDLGPEGGDGGGEVVATGTPEAVCEMDASYTGPLLRPALMNSRPCSTRANGTRSNSAGLSSHSVTTSTTARLHLSASISTQAGP